MFTALVALLLGAGPAPGAEPAYPLDPDTPADRAALEARFGTPDSENPLDTGLELRWTVWATEIRDAGRGAPTVAGDGTGIRAVPGTYRAPAIVRHRCDITALLAPGGAVTRFETRGSGCERVLSRPPAAAGGAELRQR